MLRLVQMAETDALAILQAENARLIALLEAHGIQWRLPAEPASAPAQEEISAHGANCVKGIPDCFCQVGNAAS
jgi:hypothetical protein